MLLETDHEPFENSTISGFNNLIYLMGLSHVFYLKPAVFLSGFDLWCEPCMLPIFRDFSNGGFCDSIV